MKEDAKTHLFGMYGLLDIANAMLNELEDKEQIAAIRDGLEQCVDTMLKHVVAPHKYLFMGIDLETISMIHGMLASDNKRRVIPNPISIEDMLKAHEYYQSNKETIEKSGDFFVKSGVAGTR